MKRDDSLLKSVERLLDLEVEYDMTVRVLAVLVEQVQHLSRSDEIHISDETLLDQPDLTAWRDAKSGVITLKATR
jgi:hypothetical protein